MKLPAPLRKCVAWAGCILLCGPMLCAATGTEPVNNRAPLVSVPYSALPLGDVKAKGWLLEMLERQRTGSTGRLDELYPEVMGARNGWLGGDGDQWERGPYWIDGLLPLAYILDDDSLKRKVQPWVEWALASQKPHGSFGPEVDLPYEEGLQRDMTLDWWPRMVVLKILRQYYSATGDERVIDFMTRYFHHQLAVLPQAPLGHWTYWGEYREADNLMAVYWLYNITGDSKLLELADLLHEQGVDFTHMFLETDAMRQFKSIHCVNLAQGLKEPVIYYQQHPEQRYLDAVDKGFSDLMTYNGQPQGMYGGDEHLHGAGHTQGSELCSAVELMFSLENMMLVTGDVRWMDHLEKVAYNALPTQISDDFMTKQYFQQPNQVKITVGMHNFYEDYYHAGTDIVFGERSGFPCCYSNMHQGWPKFTHSTWARSADGGLAALVYAPTEVTALLPGDVRVTVAEETCYPMDDVVRFKVGVENGKARFPLHLRVPQWCDSAEVVVNGKPADVAAVAGTMAVINREWTDGDEVTLTMPMKVKAVEGFEKGLSVERGPLVYALKMNETVVPCTFEGDAARRFGKHYKEVHSDSKWNYGLFPASICEATVFVDKEKQRLPFFWNNGSAPIEIKVKGKAIPSWGLYNEMAGPLPVSPSHPETPVEELTLIPYGCTTLRVSVFPQVD